MARHSTSERDQLRKRGRRRAVDPRLAASRRLDEQVSLRAGNAAQVRTVEGPSEVEIVDYHWKGRNNGQAAQAHASR
jgi:hypothetical protein